MLNYHLKLLHWLTYFFLMCILSSTFSLAMIILDLNYLFYYLLTKIDSYVDLSILFLFLNELILNNSLNTYLLMFDLL